MSTQILLQGITLEELAKELEKYFVLKGSVRVKEPENDLMTRKEVCKLLSIVNVTLWKHTKSGKFKSYGIGNRIFYKRSEVLEAVKPTKDFNI
jgi:predicted DNA-binding transcriptional regulator AlpA